MKGTVLVMKGKVMHTKGTVFVIKGTVLHNHVIMKGIVLIKGTVMHEKGTVFVMKGSLFVVKWTVLHGDRTSYEGDSTA